MTAFLAIAAMVILTLLLTFAFSKAYADVECEFETVTEQTPTGRIATYQKHFCVERTINGKPKREYQKIPPPPQPSDFNLDPDLARLAKRPGCYEPDSYGNIIVDPACPAWLNYLKAVDEHQGYAAVRRRIVDNKSGLTSLGILAKILFLR